MNELYIHLVLFSITKPSKSNSTSPCVQNKIRYEFIRKLSPRLIIRVWIYSNHLQLVVLVNIWSACFNLWRDQTWQAGWVFYLSTLSGIKCQSKGLCVCVSCADVLSFSIRACCLKRATHTLNVFINHLVNTLKHHHWLLRLLKHPFTFIKSAICAINKHMHVKWNICIKECMKIFFMHIYYKNIQNAWNL